MVYFNKTELRESNSKSFKAVRVGTLLIIVICRATFIGHMIKSHPWHSLDHINDIFTNEVNILTKR